MRKAEGILGHAFHDHDLVLTAITHPSAVEGKRGDASYERLEFLGDSILGAIVATELFERFPEMNEGELTRLKISLVSGETLSMVARDLGVGDLIVFGVSELGTGARGMHSALENVYESLVGALYLDAGYEATRSFVLGSLSPHMTPELAHVPESPKSRLQELTQRDLHCAPEYKLLGSEGPAHDPTFTCVAMVGGRRMGRGTGSSKKAAESAAALDAIERLGYARDSGDAGSRED